MERIDNDNCLNKDDYLKVLDDPDFKGLKFKNLEESFIDDDSIFPLNEEKDIKKPIDLKKILDTKNAKLYRSLPSKLKDFSVKLITKILKLEEINTFLIKNSDRKNFDFIDEVFDYLDFTYKVSEKDLRKIPSEGRVIIISNHPLGALDGLALLKMVSNVRKDVKVVVNDILLNLKGLEDLFLGYNIFSHKIQRKNIQKINECLEKDQALIFFPAGEVSRFKLAGGIRDSKWQRGVLHFAKKYQTPVLPIFGKARNSILFYILSLINKNLSIVLLPRELFSKKGKSIEFRIGDYIAFQNLQNTNKHSVMKLLKKHTYRIGHRRKGIFKTEKNIIHPVDKVILKNELKEAEFLGSPAKDFSLYLVKYEKGQKLLQEISRLRELTFRKIGEGTGDKKDSDIYDKYYYHLLLWNDKDLEIAGSYRFGYTKDILKFLGIKGLYNSTLFDMTKKYEKEILSDSIELGRSFIQQRYWNTFALDYLWHGLGAYLVRNNEVKYLTGAVSISEVYPKEVKDMLVFFFQRWFDFEGFFQKVSCFEKDSSFKDLKDSIKSRNPYIIINSDVNILKELFITSEEEMLLLSKEDLLRKFSDEYKLLKKHIKIYGFAVPVLFNHYTKLCSENGVCFPAWNVDESFSNCLDGYILLEIDKIKESKRKRYFTAPE